MGDHSAALLHSRMIHKPLTVENTKERVLGSSLEEGVTKLGPVGQSQPITCLCTALELKIAFSFLNSWEGNQKTLL